MISKEEQFVDKLLSGLEGVKFRHTLLAYLFNLTILLFFYIASIYWVEVEDSYYAFIPVVLIILVAMEYILATLLIEKRGKLNSVENTAPTRRHINNKLIHYLFVESKYIPCNLAVVSVAFVLMIPFSAWYISKTQVAELRYLDDGGLFVSVPLSPSVKVKNQPSARVFAVLSPKYTPQNQSWYYVAPVSLNGGIMNLALDDQSFLKTDEYHVDYYINALDFHNTNQVLNYRPQIPSKQFVGYDLNLKELKIKTSYCFFQER